MSKIKGTAIFLLGGIFGAAVTWKYAKNFYEQRAQDEINSVKKVFTAKRKTENKEEKEKTDNIDLNIEKENELPKNEKQAAKQIINNAKYVTSDQSYTKENDHPYVISPDEFGELDEYDQISLTYYAGRQILVDEDGSVITNDDEIVGTESLSRFGEYEDDTVFVRNDKLKCDYEILLEYDEED